MKEKNTRIFPGKINMFNITKELFMNLQQSRSLYSLYMDICTTQTLVYYATLISYFTEFPTEFEASEPNIENNK